MPSSQPAMLVISPRAAVLDPRRPGADVSPFSESNHGEEMCNAGGGFTLSHRTRLGESILGSTSHAPAMGD